MTTIQHCPALLAPGHDPATCPRCSDGSFPRPAPAPHTFKDLGYAAYNMSLDDFEKALDLYDDQYARDKFIRFREIGRIMGEFSDSTLNKLIDHYLEKQARRAQSR